MPSVTIPESGVSFDGPPPASSSKPDETAPNAIGLTLTNAMIEEMIRCVQDGKPIQLSLGLTPSLSIGSKTQHLATFDDPFTHELYRTTTTPDPEYSNKSESNKRPMTNPNSKPNLTWSRQFFNKSLQPIKKRPPPLAKAATTSRESFGAEEDPALKTLRNSLQSETDKKKENVTRMIDTPGRGRGQAPKVKSSHGLLSHNNRFSDTSRSMPASPVTNALNSPKQGPTSVPLSQQQAELSRAARKPVVHLLALDPMLEEALEAKLPDISQQDLQHALNKVADQDAGSKKWHLRRAFYKELDVWKFDYDSQAVRQKVIDNAIKVFDKMRLSQSEPEWEKLKPNSQRGDGVSLSKIQAKIAQGPIPRTPKIHVDKTESGRDTPNRNDRDPLGDKASLRGKGEAMARSASQPAATTTKPKKTSEKTAQTKRLLSNPSKKPAPKVTSKKEASKSSAKPLSKERITDSDEEDDDFGKQQEPVAPAAIPKKRARDEESSTSSDSSIPLSKKVKKPAPAHRVSDASQSSRNTTSTTTSSSSKTKGNSPQKSSPLASSPPTNASDFEDSSSSSSTPAHVSTKNSRSPIHKRHQKSSSVTSSTSSTSSYANLKPHVLELAAKYRMFYPKYAALYRELSADAEYRDQKKEDTLLDMHDRLLKMKNEIKEATAAAEMEM